MTPMVPRCSIRPANTIAMPASLNSGVARKTPARIVPRSIHEAAREKARPILPRLTPTLTSRRERKKVEMLFAHLKRILRLDRLRLRGPCGAHDEFLLAATALKTYARWPS